MTNVSAFFDEFLGTAVLMLVVLAMTDKQNTPPPPGLAPLVLFMLVLGIGVALGVQTGAFIHSLSCCLFMKTRNQGYAINPARDLGPRILTSMVGYGKAVYTFRKYVLVFSSYDSG